MHVLLEGVCVISVGCRRQWGRRLCCRHCRKSSRLGWQVWVCQLWVCLGPKSFCLSWGFFIGLGSPSRPWISKLGERAFQGLRLELILNLGCARLQLLL
jgi:hypothetical protein